MKKPVKAALLSTFLFPGAGHFFLKKYALCVVFSCTFSVPLYFIISDIMTKAEQVLDQIKKGDIPLDITAISESLSSSTVGLDTQELNIIMYALIIIWFIGIIDSYRLGRTKDNKRNV